VKAVIAHASRHLGFTLRALRHRNYRLFFGGQLVSLCGTWMTNVATGWLVYQLTGSPLMLGVVTFAGQFPVFILGPFAGLLGDRVDKRRGLVVLQTLCMSRPHEPRVATRGKLCSFHSCCSPRF
jgi:MFS family permease